MIAHASALVQTLSECLPHSFAFITEATARRGARASPSRPRSLRGRAQPCLATRPSSTSPARASSTTSLPSPQRRVCHHPPAFTSQSLLPIPLPTYLPRSLPFWFSPSLMSILPPLPVPIPTPLPPSIPPSLFSKSSCICLMCPLGGHVVSHIQLGAQ